MIPKNKRISVLHPYLNKRGGAVNMMIYISNLLLKEGNNIKFYTLSYNKDLFSKEINFEVIVSNKIGISYKIRKSDYIIIGNSPMHFVGVISKILFFSKAKLIWRHHHYPWYYCENANFLILIKRFLEKVSVSYIDSMVVNSNYLKTIVDNIYGTHSKVLYPIIDDDFFGKIKNEKDYQSKTIFTYGRWVKGKNIKQIFDTYSYLQKNNNNIKLCIGGVGEELDLYKSKFKTDKKISFLGLLDVNSIIHNLNKSNVFLFPSKIDSFGMTVLEAQILGVPVIAFDINGVKEIIINGKTGFLVENSQEFSEKTALLLNDVFLQTEFGKNTKLLLTKFGKNNFMKQLGNIFNQ